MSKCEVCNKECTGTTCSGACRAKLSRRTRTASTPAHAHDVGAQARRTQSSARIGKEPDFNGCPSGCFEPVSLSNPEVMERVLEQQAEHLRPEPKALDHYYANPDLYVIRAAPELLNWSAPMSAMELEQAGLKANRVTIPGDWDYSGVCEQVEGKWRVKA